MTLSEQILSAVRTIPDFPKPGIQYKDISTLFLRPDLVGQMIETCAKELSAYQADAVAGIESRGFLLGAAIAAHMQLPFVMIRKAGKLPAATYQEIYALEYGTASIEMHCDALEAGSRVIVIDDVLATGGTAIAACNLIKKAGSLPLVCSFIAELEFLDGRRKIESSGIEVLSLVKY